MMDIELKRYERMLLELLRTALGRTQIDNALFMSVNENDWISCYRLACEQGVMALAWDGILTLPTSLFPPKRIKLSWAIAVEKYERRYCKYVHTLSELINLYSENKIDVLQLKGVGLSSYYPNPKHREGGDIDIYTYSMDKTSLTDQQANDLADRLIEDRGIVVERINKKHSSFFFEGIPIENHKKFVDVIAIRSAVSLDDFLRGIIDESPVSLLDGVCEVNIPSPAFNTVFLAYHTIQHYGDGLCLHHLCDWACLLKKYGLVIPKGFNDERVLSMIELMTRFTNLYLGTSVKVDDSKKGMNDFLFEMLRSPYKKDFVGKNKLEVLIYKVRRVMHKLKIRKKILGEPIFHGILHSICYHSHNPYDVFQK